MSKTTNKNEKTGLFDWLINHSKLILVIVVMLALLVSSALIGYALITKKTADDPNVVAEVAGEKVYLKEYKERFFAANGGAGSLTAPLVNTTTKAVKDSVLNDLVELKVIDKELAKKNIVISDTELISEAKKLFKDYDTRDVASQKAYKDYVRLKIGKDKLLSYVSNWKEGYVLYCYFYRADMDDFVNKPEASAKRQADKVYAQDYCTKMKQRLETGQSNYQEELTKLKADPQIGENAWRPYLMSFTLEIKKDTFLNTPNPVYDLSNKLSSLGNDREKYYLITLQDKPSGSQNNDEITTKELESQGTKATAKKQDSTTKKQKEDDSLFAVVYVKDGHKGETNDFKKWLESKYQEYKVKTYLERVKL